MCTERVQRSLTYILPAGRARLKFCTKNFKIADTLGFVLIYEILQKNISKKMVGYILESKIKIIAKSYEKYQNPVEA